MERSVTPAQIRTEHRASALLIAVALLTAGLPCLVPILSDESSVTFLTLITPPLIWAWNFYFYGFARMMRGLAMLMRSDDGPTQQAEEQIERFARALALESGISLPAFLIAQTNLEGRPYIEASIADKEATHVFSAEENEALLDLLTGDGDVYKCVLGGSFTKKVEPRATPISRHDALSDLALLERAKDEARHRRKN